MWGGGVAFVGCAYSKQVKTHRRNILNRISYIFYIYIYCTLFLFKDKV